MLNIDFLGQVFTPDDMVEKMLKLRKNKGSILEPSCGAGAFLNKLKKAVGIEFDPRVCPEKALNIDFFDYPTSKKFDTIIGNPPYVKFKNIEASTKNKLDLAMFDERTNLYLFFIKKCIEHLNHHGELIFIVPRDFVKASSGVKLNKFIYSQGTITDWVDLGDSIVFPGFSPNCIIFRFEKNNFSRKTHLNGKMVDFKEMNGQLIFSENTYPINFSDLFFVKVGAVSGADKYFIHSEGNKEFVCSETKTNGRTKRMLYNIVHPHLEKNKEVLIKRKLRKFNDTNWYMWGRNHYISDEPRIYVNSKTRKKDPFFIHNCPDYDGSVIAIFPKFKIKNKAHLKKVCKLLNQVNWNELGFICNNRFLFTQRSLEQSHLPARFEKI